MAATVDDVRDLIATELRDPEVQTWLDRTDRAVAREYDTDAFESEQHRDDLLATLTAFRIVSGRDRRPSGVSLGNASKTYDQREADFLRGLIRRADPGSAFSAGGLTRDADRLTARCVSRPRP